MLNKETAIAFISDKVMLKENLKEIAPEMFAAIKEFLKDQAGFGKHRILRRKLRQGRAR